jgi:hypothetical protein
MLQELNGPTKVAKIHTDLTHNVDVWALDILLKPHEVLKHLTTVITAHL